MNNGWTEKKKKRSSDVMQWRYLLHFKFKIKNDSKTNLKKVKKENKNNNFQKSKSNIF